MQKKSDSQSIKALLSKNLKINLILFGIIGV